MLRSEVDDTVWGAGAAAWTWAAAAGAAGACDCTGAARCEVEGVEARDCGVVRRAADRRRVVGAA